MSVSPPLVRTLEGHQIDFHVWRRNADRDGVRDVQELAEGVALLERMIPDLTLMTETIGHVMSCFNGSRGLDSPSIERALRERERSRRSNVSAFPRRYGEDAAVDPDEAA